MKTVNKARLQIVNNNVSFGRKSLRFFFLGYDNDAITRVNEER